MRIAISLLLVLAGCATSQPKSPPPTAAELESRLLQSESVQRMDVDDPPGWYWLLTRRFGLFETIGRSDPEFEIRDGKAVPSRLMGAEGDALRQFDAEPQALEWLGETRLFMVEVEKDGRSLTQKARFVAWGPPVLLESDGIALVQTAEYEADVTSVFINGRKYKDGDRTPVGWWGYHEVTSRKERSLVRVRYFDRTSAQWPALQRAIESAALHEDRKRSLLAGAAAFEELGLAGD